jgi:Ser/Thr protein kinase RdoA (MazF antagonist)
MTDTARESRVIDRLTGSYGLTVAGLALLGGEFDRNYRVTTETGRQYLAKWQAHRGDEREQRWREDILVHAAGRDAGVAIPTIVPTVDGARHDTVGPDDTALTLFDWVPGIEWSKVDGHSEALLRRLGATAARITKALRGFPHDALPPTHHWDVTRSREAITSCLVEDPGLADRDFVDTTLRWFDDAAPTLPSLPRAVVHQDLNDHNVLVDPERDAIAGVLDFNDALFGLRVAEVAIAGAYAMLRRSHPLNVLGHVVAGYHGVTPLRDDELAVVYPLAAARLCVQVLTWTARDRTTPTEYGSMRMRHTMPTLQRVLTVDVDRATEHLRSAAESTESEPGRAEES